MESSEAGSVKHPSLMSWRYGDAWSRFFHLPMAGLAVIVGLTFLMGMLDRWPFETMLSVAMVLFAYVPFHETFAPGMVTARVWRESVRQGVFEPEKTPYFEELVRFIEEEGEGGRLPGALRWALAYWAVYYALLVAAIPFTLAFFPALSWLTHVLYSLLVVVPVGVTCFVLNRRRLHRLLGEEARRRGFRLMELHDELKVRGW